MEVRQNVFRKKPPGLARIDHRSEWGARQNSIKFGGAMRADHGLELALPNLLEQFKRLRMMGMG